MTLISGLVCMFHASSASADDGQNMFSYTANGDTQEINFVQSNIEGLFEGQKFARQVSEQFSFEMVQLKTLRKQFDYEHRNTLESNTRVDLRFGKNWFNRIQIGQMRQDINTFNQQLNIDQNSQRMYSGVQGWEKIFDRNFKLESYVGIVQCADVDAGSQKYYPIFGAKMTKNFGGYGELQVHAAQEVQGGGSYTGMYGNQIFKKMMVTARIPILKSLSFLWDAGIGVTESSFSEKGFSSSAKVATSSASIEYAINENVKGAIGYSHRSLMDQSGYGTEGHMMSASLSFARF